MKKLSNILHRTGRQLLIPVLVMGLILPSCQEEDVINLLPFNQIDMSVAFSTPSLVELSVIGMYNAAQLGFYAGTPRGYPFGAAFVQQGDNRGEDVVNRFAFYAFTYQNNISPTTMNNVWYWIDTYRLINRINMVIEGVQTAADNGVITQALANIYKGEALLLRAHAYHELLVFFARPFRNAAYAAANPGVPYHKTPFLTMGAVETGMAVGRHTVAQGYQFILDDLNQAEEWLPLRTERPAGPTRITRGTKGAAAALKVRIHQHMWNWDGVIAEGNKFLTGGIYAGHYALGANPWDVFRGDYTSPEMIFGMENSATNNPGVNGSLAQMYHVAPTGRALVAHSPINWRNPFWRINDRRRGPDLVRFGAGAIAHVPFTHKFDDPVGSTDVSPMMRFAEVILNLAEAHARRNAAGDFDQALTLLNMVRNRALVSPATEGYISADFANNILLLNAILHERRIEFAMEGRRWPDILRLQHCPHFPIDGIPAKFSNGTPAATHYVLTSDPLRPGFPTAVTIPVAREAAVPYTDRRFLWPIPQAEIDTNPTLAAQQNPGW